MLHQRYLKSKQIIVLLFSAAQPWCLCFQKWTVFRIQTNLLQNQVSVHLINFSYSYFETISPLLTYFLFAILYFQLQSFFYIFFQILFSLDLFFQEEDLCLQLLLEVISCCPHTDDVFPVLEDQLPELLDQGLAEICILLCHAPALGKGHKGKAVLPVAVWELKSLPVLTSQSLLSARNCCHSPLGHRK